MQQTHSIGELAREFGITTRAIRFYEDQGLITPARSGTARVYRPRDRIRLKLILRGKRLGFSLKEIQGIIDLYDAPGGEAEQLRHFVDKIRQRREALLRQREDIEVVLAQLEAVQEHCTRLLAEKDVVEA